MDRRTSRSTLTVNKTNPSSREYEIRRSSATRVMSGGPGSNSYVHTNVNNAVEGREKEKREMQELNERLANYIEKVRFLEAQNKRLNNELRALRDRWGKETQRIRDLYEIEMEQLKKLLDEAETAKSELGPRLNKLDNQLREYQQAIDEANQQHDQDADTMEGLNRQLSECEGEIGLLRRRIAALEDERSRRKKRLNKLRDAVKRTRMDLDNETMNHMAADAEVQSLKDEIEFMKESHDNEMKELAALAYRDTTSENRDYWKHEMSSALHEMYKEYDAKMDAMRSEIESHYSMKVQEMRSSQPREVETVHLKEENSRLKTQMNNLRSKGPELEAKNAQLERLLEELRRELDRQTRDFEADCDKLRNDVTMTQDELDQIIKELQDVMDMKLSLELEIEAYRKLLEGEESRSGLRNMMEQTIFGMGSSKTDGLYKASSAGKVQASNQVKGEINAKTSHQRTAKGNVIIHETSADGKYIILENTGKNIEDISGFRIERNIDNGRIIVQYDFPSKTVLSPDGQNRFVKIWSRGNKPPGSKDLECQSSTWGVGNQIFTCLLNKNNEERATHTQKTVYQN